jgi:hypothetical protein
MHLSLIHHTRFVAVQKFYGVFNRDYVFMSLNIDSVYHGRECGRFAGTCGPCDQNQALGLVTEFIYNGRQSQFLKGWDLVGDQTKRPGQGPPLHENIRSESAQPAKTKRQVQFLILFESMFLGFGENAVAQVTSFLCRQGRTIERQQFIPDSNHRRNSGCNVQIRSPASNHLPQKIVKSGQLKFLRV